LHSAGLVAVAHLRLKMNSCLGFCQLYYRRVILKRQELKLSILDRKRTGVAAVICSLSKGIHFLNIKKNE